MERIRERWARLAGVMIDRIAELERENDGLREQILSLHGMLTDAQAERDWLADALRNTLTARDSIESMLIARNALASLNQFHASSSEQKDTDRAEK